jgi:hypothetical protein
MPSLAATGGADQALGRIPLNRASEFPATPENLALEASRHALPFDSQGNSRGEFLSSRPSLPHEKEYY